MMQLSGEYDENDLDDSGFCEGPDFQDDDLKLDHIPDVSECRAIIKRFQADNFWPNVWHINDHGNVDLLAIRYTGAEIYQSWV